MKITKETLKQIIKEERAKLLNESYQLSDIATEAAHALRRRDPQRIKELISKYLAPPADEDGDHEAVREMLEAMAEAARKLRDQSEEESNWSRSMRDGY